MRNRISLVALFALGAALTGARAQAPEDAAVIRAAAAYVRDSLPQGLRAIDASLFEGRRPLATAVADQIANELGFRKARLRDLHQCTGPAPARRPVCTIGGYVAVLGFSEPRVQGRVARVWVSWTYQLNPTRLAGRELHLELSRTGAGQWQVTRVLSNVVS